MMPAHQWIEYFAVLVSLVVDNALQTLDALIRL
jgi:hypothetical protein